MSQEIEDRIEKFPLVRSVSSSFKKNKIALAGRFFVV